MNIYLIAGPPGIGKSTNAKHFIPKGIAIIDQDLAGYQYKKKGFTDYKDLASIQTNQKIRESLFDNVDFALELNLGFQSHYEFLNSIASFDRSNKIHLLLFFTNDLDLCIDRANVRHLSGGHEVKREVIEEMYSNTLPLFEKFKYLFDSVRLLDVTDISIKEFEKGSEDLPLWIMSSNMYIYLNAAKD
jgi:predicted ABC-type ATPase